MFKNTPAFSSFSVNDLAEAKRFYGEVLGLDVSETKEGMNIKLKNGPALFLYAKQDHAPATFTVLNFDVPDIDQAVEKLSAKGIAFERYNMGEMKPDEKGIYRGRATGQGPDVAWFKDPAGNILSVLQE